MNAAANLVEITKDEAAAITERSSTPASWPTSTRCYGVVTARRKASRTYQAGAEGRCSTARRQRDKRRVIDVVDRA